jgi:hypothetical protein
MISDLMFDTVRQIEEYEAWDKGVWYGSPIKERLAALKRDMALLLVDLDSNGQLTGDKREEAVNRFLEEARKDGIEHATRQEKELDPGIRQLLENVLNGRTR